MLRRDEAADPVVQASRAHCRRVARQAGSSFYPCFLLLPRAKREAMEALYAFLRHTDDLGDNPSQPISERRAALVEWRSALAQVLQQRDSSATAPSPTPGPCPPTSDPSSLPALADAVRRFSIPPEYLTAVLDGVEMDLDGRRYESFEDLAEYCHRVASVVGLACIHIWGFRGPEALEPARKCGLAFQLTNILRDLKEDAAQGRFYLPLADFRQCEYSPEDLAGGVADDRFARLMHLELDRARRLYGEGAELFDWLAPGGRRVFGMMMTTYRRLLAKIEAAPYRVLTSRVQLTRWQKLRIAARWALLPPRRSALP